MRGIGLFLIFLLVLEFSLAEAKQARGATKRRHKQEPPAVDVDDIIRAEFDPHFADYLKQKEIDQKNQEVGLKKYNEEKRAWEAAREKERQKYNREFEKLNPVVDEEKGEREHLRQQLAWEAEQEKSRQEYVKRQQLEAQKQEVEKLSRLQKAFSSDRMPSSVKAK